MARRLTTSTCRYRVVGARAATNKQRCSCTSIDRDPAERCRSRCTAPQMALASQSNQRHRLACAVDVPGRGSRKPNPESRPRSSTAGAGAWSIPPVCVKDHGHPRAQDQRQPAFVMTTRPPGQPRTGHHTRGVAMSRRRRPRNDRTMEVASEQHMTAEAQAHAALIREQAEEYTPAPIPDQEIDAEVAARDEAADEIAAGMADLEAEEETVDNTPVPDSIPAVPDAFTDGDLDDEGPGDDYPRRGDVERDVANFVDEWPNPVELEPIIDPEIFERGPLAASIRIFEAMLSEAKAGYIAAQIDEVERVTEESFNADEREFLATVAAQEKTVTGLPDVAGAYRALVGIKARVAA